MKKIGFTLAEVLITLGIVGVVAAVTLPTLDANVGISKIGPTLSKFVNTLENGISSMIAEEDIPELEHGEFANFMNHMDRYVKWAPLSTIPPTYAIKRGSTTYIANENFNNRNVRLLKNGTLVSFVSTKTNDGTTAPTTYFTTAYVDINGVSGKNQIGQDVFVFELYSDGSVVPYGSSEYIKLYEGIEDNVPQCNPDADTFAQLAACTGNIADNGWKVKY